jgi:tetratricopeptide (TPR) repeat protein
MDNEPGNFSSYKKDDDFEDLNIKNREDEFYDNPLQKGDFAAFLTEEMSEPDISYWCRDSPDASQLLSKCIKMLNDKNYKTMKTYLQTVEDFENDSTIGNPNSEKINKLSFVKNFYLGIAHFKEAEYDEALNSFNKARKLFQYYQLHYNLALCYMKKNNLYDAIINLDSVITKNPNFYFAYYNLIKIYLANRNPSQAYVNYRRLSDV